MPNQYSYSPEYAAMRREYGRLRSIAQKRVTRLYAADLDQIAGWYNAYDIRKLSQISSMEELQTAMDAVNRFLSRPTTVGEARLQYANLMEILNRRYASNYNPATGEGAIFTSYDQINEQGRYFEYLRLRYGRHYVSKNSGDLYDFFLDQFDACAGDGINIARTVHDFFDTSKAENEMKRARQIAYAEGKSKSQRL